MKRLKKKLPARTKYELTLAEFPCFFLPKAKAHQNYIEYKDIIHGRRGEIVSRIWRVMPDPEHGFGSETTLQLLFELFQLWHEQHFQQPYIVFGTIHHLLKRMNKSANPDAYRRIKRDLDILCGMNIDAHNAFWDNEKKTYVDVFRFNIFQYWENYKEKLSHRERILPLGRIWASDLLYGSIQANAILTTDFERKFFHNLTPLERRLALYLSKVFRSQSTHQRNIMKLAQQMPLQTTHKGKAKQTLTRASQGLLNKGFLLLNNFSYNGQVIIFKRKGKPKKIPKWITEVPEENRTINNTLVEDILEVCKDEKSRDFYNKIAILIPKEIIYRALSETKVARDLGKIKKSIGAIFTSLIYQYAKEIKVVL